MTDKTRIPTLNLINEAEAALGENLVWLSDMFDQYVRQQDPEVLRRLKQLNDGWIACVHLQERIKIHGPDCTHLGWTL